MAADRSTLLIAEGAILAFCTIVCIAVQLDRRVTNRSTIDASRWFLLIGACLALAMTGMVIAMAARGLGTPMPADEFAQNQYLGRLVTATSTPYLLCNMFIKLSWLTFYYGLACNRAQNVFIHIMQFIAVAFGLSSVAVVLVVLGFSYQPAGRPPPINIIAFYYANTAIMIANDTVMYLTPIWLLRHNAMIRRNQAGIYVLFAMGGIIVVASVLRLVAVHDFDQSSNPSGATAMIWFWSSIENHLGICIACAGALKQRYILGMRKLRDSWIVQRSMGSWSSLRSTKRSGRSGSSDGGRSGSGKAPLEVFKTSDTTVTSSPMSSGGGSSAASTFVADISMQSIQSKCWFDTGDVATLLSDEDARSRINDMMRS